MTRAACQLYQLHSRRYLADGTYVEVNGPWDRYGVVMSSKQEPDGRWLNQVRGVQQRQGWEAVYRF